MNYSYVIEVLNKDLGRLRKLYAARLSLIQSLQDNGQNVNKHQEALLEIKRKASTVKEVINMVEALNKSC